MGERTASARRGRPPRLTRDEIVRAARELLEREGVAALTMRRLAREVGGTPMALYHHVADKDELLLLVLEQEAASLRPPSEPADPRDRIVATARFVREVLDARPWVLEAIAPGVRFGRSSLPLVERIVAGFVACGLRPDDAGRAYRALWYQIAGELTVRHSARRAAAQADASSGNGAGRDDFATTTMTSLDPRNLPLLAEIGPRWQEIADGYDAEAVLGALVDGLIARYSERGR